jgi:hypothetical protein
MATINLGAIKFNWKGAYNSSTSYAVDDVVSSGGNSYVCIQAHSNQAVGNATAYWNIMSSAGTNGTNGSNGTDVGTTITTQGDILYRDGSGLARLPAGTANQLLKTGGSGANPSWTDAPVGGAKSFHQIDRTSIMSSSTVDTWVQVLNPITMTPASASSRMVLNFNSLVGVSSVSCSIIFKITREISGGATTDLDGTMGKRQSANVKGLWGAGEEMYENTYTGHPISFQYTDLPNTTSEVSYKIYVFQGAPSHSFTLGSVYANGNNNEYPAIDTRLTLTEL